MTASLREVCRRSCSTSFCFLGCVLLVPSCILLSSPTKIGLVGLSLACLCLTVAAMIDLYDAYFLLRSTEESVLGGPAQRRRAFHTKLYFLIGAGLFLTASLMYLPFFASQFMLGTTMADLGTWVFRFGSCAYLGGNYRCAKDVIKSAQMSGYWQKQDVVNLIAICAFSLGSLLYISGGVVGQMKIGTPTLMYDFWVIGSIGFAIGSLIHFINAMGRGVK